MIEMKYESRYEAPKMLHTGTYLGYIYVILSQGTHPTAYIAIPKGNKYYGKKSNSRLCQHIKCHGGITYADNFLRCAYEDEVMTSKKFWFIGWDYAHATDFRGCDDGMWKDLKRWTVKEIEQECKQVIMQIAVPNWID